MVKKADIKDRIVDILEEQRESTLKMELTREEDLRYSSIVGRSPGPPSFAGAPVFIILCGDTRTKEAYPLRAVYSHRDSIFVSSLADAFLYMHLAAASLGLGSQWVTSIAHPFEQSLLKELLGIPHELEIYDMMAVGYPAYQPEPRMVRKLDEMTHRDRYDKTKHRTAEEIRSFIVELRGRRGVN